MAREFFPWRPEYSVKSEILDAQHKKLFDIANELYDAFTAGEHKEKLDDIIRRLHEYTVYHFAEEEKEVKAAGHSLSQDHLDQHTQFVKKIGDVMEKHEAGRATVTYGLMTFLGNWLKDHIMQVDQQYSKLLEKNN